MLTLPALPDEGL